MLRDADTYYETRTEPVRSCMLALRSIILAADTLVTETTKYGMPCFCYGKKAFCYLWTDKKTGEPYMLMTEGQLLHHPLLEAGDRARMKIFRVRPDEDIPVATVRELVSSALDLYKSGRVKVK